MRQLRQCERLAEIAMELTEAARGEALKEFQPPAPRRSYAAHSIPGISLPEPPPFPRTTIFNDLVMQLSRCVRQAILLECRIDSGAFDHPPPKTPDRDTALRDPQASQRQPSDQTRIVHERLEDDSVANASQEPSDILSGLTAELAEILDSGALPGRPAPVAHTPLAAPPRRGPDAPSNPQSRARRHVLQQATPPPPSG